MSDDIKQSKPSKGDQSAVKASGKELVSADPKTEKTKGSTDIVITDQPDNAVPSDFRANQGDLSMSEDLPEDIKAKLEKRKQERAKSLAKSKKKKKRQQKHVSTGKAFIKATYNNTIVTLTDNSGNVLSWASAGVVGFRGPKKSTPYAAQIIARVAIARAKEFGLEEVSVFVKGVGTGRESAVRALYANGLNVTSIKDITALPHNGCRPKKPRRV